MKLYRKRIPVMCHPHYELAWYTTISQDLIDAKWLIATGVTATTKLSEQWETMQCCCICADSSGMPRFCAFEKTQEPTAVGKRSQEQWSVWHQGNRTSGYYHNEKYINLGISHKRNILNRRIAVFTYVKRNHMLKITGTCTDYFTQGLLSVRTLRISHALSYLSAATQ
jgi:hypothetical protein